SIGVGSQRRVTLVDRQSAPKSAISSAPRYLLRDRDSIYGDEFRSRVKGMQIEEVIAAPHSPFQNEYASHYTSSVLSGMNAFIRSLSRSFWPCALTGGCGPGSSYKRAFLSS